MKIKSYIKCRGCGKPIVRGRFKFCPDCLPLNNRMLNEHIPAKGRESFWVYLRKYGARCCLSGVSLELKDYTSPWYLVFSRVNPGDKTKILPAAALFNGMKSALINEMKGDLTEAEFWYLLSELANFYINGTPVKKIKLKFWARPYRSFERMIIKNESR